MVYCLNESTEICTSTTYFVLPSTSSWCNSRWYFTALIRYGLSFYKLAGSPIQKSQMCYSRSFGKLPEAGLQDGHPRTQASSPHYRAKCLIEWKLVKVMVSHPRTLEPLSSKVGAASCCGVAHLFFLPKNWSLVQTGQPKNKKQTNNDPHLCWTRVIFAQLLDSHQETDHFKQTLASDKMSSQNYARNLVII